MRKIIFICISACLLWSMSLTGQTDLKGLIIYIDFPDAPATVTQAQMNSFVNGVNYSEGAVNRSVRDYWKQQSRNEIDLTHEVVTYRAPRTHSYYKSRTYQQNYDLLEGALDYVASLHPLASWWNQFDIVDNDVINTSIKEGGFLSVHFVMSKHELPVFTATHTIEWYAPNGIRTRKVVTAPLGNFPGDSPPANISHLCHEMGHALFQFPDLYDSNGGSKGTGIYTLMSRSGTEIPPIGAGLLDDMGWGNFIDVSGTQTISLTFDGNDIVRYVNPQDPDELFLIEARDKNTLGNSKLFTNKGLVIWHIDNEDASNSREEMTEAEHYSHAVEQADGDFDLENDNNRGDAGDMYVPGKSFTNSTTPNSKWWDGSSSNLSITNIQISGNQISFTASAPGGGGCTTPNVNISPPSPTIENGESVTLTASGANSYSWSTGSSSSSITVSPSSTTTYTVTGTVSGGCASTESVTVVVEQCTPPNVSISPSATSIVEGSSVTLTASGASSYTWSSNLGSGSSKTVSPSSTTTYTVTGTNNGCSSTESVTVSVTPSGGGGGGNTVTVSQRIVSGSNDVEEKSTGIVSTSSTDIELVEDKGVNQTVGLRFVNLSIPQGATIVSANVQFTTDENNSGTTNLTIKAHDTNNSAAFTASNFNVSSRSTTSASVSWSPSAWNSIGQTGSNQETPDISSVIQEVVNRSGFGTSSAISIIITGTGERTAESYEGSPPNAALLTVEYSTDGGSDGGGPDDGGLLSNGVPESGNMSNSDDSDMWYIDVPANTTLMQVVLNIPSGDFDTYGKFNSEPTTSNYDWRGYTSGGESEEVNNPVAGRHYIMVKHYSGSGSYTLTATLIGSGGGGCTNPVVNITPSSSTITQGSSQTLTASGASSYSWSTGSNSSSITVSPSATTIYTVTGTTNGCTGTASATVSVTGSPGGGGDCSSPAELNKSSWSVVSVSNQTSPLLGTNLIDGNDNTQWFTGNLSTFPHEIVIDLGSTYDISKFAYVPYIGIYGRAADYNLYISNSTSNWGNAVKSGTMANTSSKTTVNINTTAGRYVKLEILSGVTSYLDYVAINEIYLTGCVSGSGAFAGAVPSTGVNFSVDESLVVYPNPNNGTFNVEYISDSSEDVIVRMYSVTGKKVLERRFEKSHNQFQTTISMKGIAKGIYQMQLISGTKSNAQSVIIR